MRSRIHKAFVDELLKIGAGFVPSDNTISAPVHYAPDNDRWKGMTTREIEKEKAKDKVRWTKRLGTR